MSGLNNLQLLAPRGATFGEAGRTLEIAGGQRQGSGREHFSTALQQFQQPVLPQQGTENMLAQLDDETLLQLKDQLENALEDYLEQGESELQERVDPALSPQSDNVSRQDIEMLLGRWQLQRDNAGQQSGEHTVIKDSVVENPEDKPDRLLSPALKAALAKAMSGLELNAGIAVVDKPASPAAVERLELHPELTAGLREKAAGTTLEKNIDSIKVPPAVKQDTATQVQANFERMLAGLTAETVSSESVVNKVLQPAGLSTDAGMAARPLLNSPTSTVLSSHIQPPQAQPVQQQLSLTGDMARWSEALGEKLAVLAGQGQQEARIRLDPPELGKLGINLSLDGNELSVRFQTAVAPVREMIESRFEQLRASLSNQGLELVSVDVDSGQQQGKHSREPETALPDQDQSLSVAESDDSLPDDITPQLRPIHLLDAFV